MLLAIDVGNTNAVYALFKDDQLVRSYRQQTIKERTEDQYAVFLGRCMDLDNLDITKIENVIIGTVVPEAKFALECFAKKHLKCDPVFITHKNAPIKIDLDNPEEVGADRLVNAVAVMKHYSAPAIVIDFGTATTFDVIGSGGVYKGGVIAPGINLSLAALHGAASKLPQITIEKPDRALGRTTRSAMKSGVYWGYVGLIKEIIAQLSGELEDEPLIIATGGLAHVFERDLSFIDQIDDDLTLKGLLEIYKFNH